MKRVPFFRLPASFPSVSHNLFLCYSIWDWIHYFFLLFLLWATKRKKRIQDYSRYSSLWFHLVLSRFVLFLSRCVCYNFRLFVFCVFGSHTIQNRNQKQKQKQKPLIIFHLYAYCILFRKIRMRDELHFTIFYSRAGGKENVEEKNNTARSVRVR